VDFQVKAIGAQIEAAVRLNLDVGFFLHVKVVHYQAVTLQCVLLRQLTIGMMSMCSEDDRGGTGA
jgi:hypothetical protein